MPVPVKRKPEVAFAGEIYLCIACEARRIAANIAKLRKLFGGRGNDLLQGSTISYLPHGIPRAKCGTNEMYYTTRLLVFIVVAGGLATAIVLWLLGELIAGGINLCV